MVGPGEPQDGCTGCRGPAADDDALRWSGTPGARRRRVLRGVVAHWSYEGSARELVRAAKFRRHRQAASYLGASLAESVQQARTPGDLLLPMPLSAERLRRRGFNQAAQMARAVARRTGLEVSVRGLVRHRDDPPQSGRPRSARLRGPRGAFRARSHLVRGRCILLVDDVLTTGATVRAAAHVLRTAGALAVTAAVACRAERR